MLWGLPDMNGICPCCGNQLNISQGIAFRLDSHTLVSSDYAVTFSANEAQVFDLFWKNRNSGKVVTKETIWTNLYALDPNGGPDPKILDVTIHKIRKRLEPTDLEIITVWGRGYFLRSKTDAAAPRLSAQELATGGVAAA
jgi:DNA-binding response OmpR family regulator